MCRCIWMLFFVNNVLMVTLQIMLASRHPLTHFGFRQLMRHTDRPSPSRYIMLGYDLELSGWIATAASTVLLLSNSPTFTISRFVLFYWKLTSYGVSWSFLNRKFLCVLTKPKVSYEQYLMPFKTGDIYDRTVIIIPQHRLVSPQKLLPFMHRIHYIYR